MESRRGWLGWCCRKSQLLGFRRRSLSCLQGLAARGGVRRASTSYLNFGLRDLSFFGFAVLRWRRRFLTLSLVSWKVRAQFVLCLGSFRALFSSLARLAKGGGVYLSLRWWLVVVLVARCRFRSSMAVPRRCCDLPPFPPLSSSLVFMFDLWNFVDWFRWSELVVFFVRLPCCHQAQS